MKNKPEPITAQLVKHVLESFGLDEKKLALLIDALHTAAWFSQEYQDDSEAYMQLALRVKTMMEFISTAQETQQ